MVVGGMHGCRGHACVGYNEIWSMSGRYASYWNVFLFNFAFQSGTDYQLCTGHISFPICNY